MKRTLLFVFLLVILIPAIIACGPAAPAKTWTLKAAWFSPDSDNTRTNLMKWYANELETRTNNRIKVEPYWAGSLLSNKDILEGTGAGACDLGELNGTLAPTKNPLLLMTNLPGLATTSYSMFRLQWELYAPGENQMPEFAAEFHNNNVVQLATFGYDSHQLWTTKEVKTLDDFKGLKLRTFGAFAKLIDALGATPISMPSGDAYTSIQKGVLDGLHWAPETVHRWKIHEVIKYKTKVDFGAIGSNALIMNMDVWNEMPDDIQQTVLQLGQDFVVHEYQQIVADDATYNEAFKAAGVVLNSMSDADLATIKAFGEPIQDEYASEVEATQGAPALKFLKIARELAPKWDAEAAQIAK